MAAIETLYGVIEGVTVRSRGATFLSGTKDVAADLLSGGSVMTRHTGGPLSRDGVPTMVQTDQVIDAVELLGIKVGAADLLADDVRVSKAHLGSELPSLRMGELHVRIETPPNGRPRPEGEAFAEAPREVSDFIFPAASRALGVDEIRTAAHQLQGAVDAASHLAPAPRVAPDPFHDVRRLGTYTESGASV